MDITIDQIALAKLVPSVDNVRRTNRAERVEELAASIAAHGLLQNLTVKPVEGGKYAVIAGGRRLAAMKLLAKQKRMAKTAPVPCVVVAEGENATEISLAENAMQAAMHPADQYEAFAALNRHGLAPEDIAARFGVTPAVVVQRLKLGAVSPKLIDLYRQGDMNLDQLSAFAITDDHALQERVWEGLAYNRNRRAILEALSEGQVWMNDRRALFVGTDAYQAAGGAIVRDLFDEDGGGYFTDVALLTRLVAEKLNALAQTVQGEGWKWVEAQPQLDHGLVAQMRRIYPEARPMSEAEQKRYDEVCSRYNELSDQLDEEGSDFPKDQLQEAEAELARLDREMGALQGEDVFKPEDVAVAGTIVSLGADGQPRIERGFVRREEETRGEVGTEDESTEPGIPVAAVKENVLPDNLTAELTAHRSAALANELAQKPDIALVATIHALAANFYAYPGTRHSSLQITARRMRYHPFGTSIEEGRAAQELDARDKEWAVRLTGESGDLWERICSLSDDERLSLLAHCVSLTLDAVRKPKALGEQVACEHADLLAETLGLDMNAYWRPTSSSYFGRITKPLILQAVREATSPEDAQTCEAMKKPDMAARAEKLVEGKDWLPELLRRQAAA